METCFLSDDVKKNPFQPQYHFCFSGCWTSRTVVLHLAEKQQKTVVCMCTCQPVSLSGAEEIIQKQSQIITG